MPYNTTACEWDVKIDLQLYWETRLRILKPTGVVILTASQPFTSELVMSNYKMFRYEWIWDKVVPTGHLNAKIMPMKVHENILVFFDVRGIYNRQFNKRNLADIKRIGRLENHNSKKYETNVYGASKSGHGDDWIWL